VNITPTPAAAARFTRFTDRVYSFEDIFYREHPPLDAVDTRPLPALPPPRPDIARDSRYRYEWLTPDGFFIDARHPRPIVRDAARKTVDPTSLAPDVRLRLVDDVEEAQFRELGGTDYVLQLWKLIYESDNE
jgi:hypothetical protein